MRIAVVGSGAIGSYYGARLAHAGSDVHFLMRGELCEVKRTGIQIRGRDENLRVEAVQCYATTAEIGVCDVVLVAFKATSNGDLPSLLPALIGDDTVLLTLQNGLGNEEFLAEYFGAERVLGGLCFVCLNRVAPGVIEHYDHGRIAVGEYGRPPRARTASIMEEFKRAGVGCSVVEDLALERWRKLVWNIPFNGLAVAAGGVDTSTIMTDRELRAAAVALMHEVIDAANCCGLPLPHAEAEVQMARTEKMGAYKPSTLIDFEAGKRLEIEAIWGEPLRRAAARGFAMPRLQLLYSVLRALSK